MDICHKKSESITALFSLTALPEALWNNSALKMLRELGGGEKGAATAHSLK
jgi:hypothetical protein